MRQGAEGGRGSGVMSTRAAGNAHGLARAPLTVARQLPLHAKRLLLRRLLVPRGCGRGVQAAAEHELRWRRLRHTFRTATWQGGTLCNRVAPDPPCALAALASAAFLGSAFCRLGAGVPPPSPSAAAFLALPSPASAFFVFLGAGLGFSPPPSMPAQGRARRPAVSRAALGASLTCVGCLLVCRTLGSAARTTPMRPLATRHEQNGRGKAGRTGYCHRRQDSTCNGGDFVIDGMIACDRTLSSSPQPRLQLNGIAPFSTASHSRPQRPVARPTTESAQPCRPLHAAMRQASRRPLRRRLPTASGRRSTTRRWEHLQGCLHWGQGGARTCSSSVHLGVELNLVRLWTRSRTTWPGG